MSRSTARHTRSVPSRADMSPSSSASQCTQGRRIPHTITEHRARSPRCRGLHAYRPGIPAGRLTTVALRDWPRRRRPSCRRDPRHMPRLVAVAEPRRPFTRTSRRHGSARATRPGDLDDPELHIRVTRLVGTATFEGASATSSVRLVVHRWSCPLHCGDELLISTTTRGASPLRGTWRHAARGGRGAARSNRRRRRRADTPASFLAAAPSPIPPTRPAPFPFRKTSSTSRVA